MSEPSLKDLRRAAGGAVAPSPSPTRHSFSKRGPVLALLGFMGVAVISSLFAMHWIASALLHSRREVVVPELTGKTLEQALDLLAPEDLGLFKESVEFDENLPPGAILRQAPPAGLRVREGKIVRVTLSSGGQVLFVPDLAGVTLAESQNRLRAAGFALGAVSQAYSGTRPEGTVLEQMPTPGAVAKPGAMVDLKVSKGNPPEGLVLMPNFVGRPLVVARGWAEDQKISPDIKEELTEAFLPGLVIRQAPGPDTPVKGDTAITLIVSKSENLAAQDVSIVSYKVPAGSGRVQVRVVLRDDAGERDVFSSAQTAGALVEVPVVPEGPARARIFVNGVLVEERTLER